MLQNVGNSFIHHIFHEASIHPTNIVLRCAVCAELLKIGKFQCL